MSNFAKMLRCDIANGIGFRVSVWLTGCPIRCKGCFNSSIWDPASGKPLDEEAMKKLTRELKKEHCQGVSILGGEPLAEWNLEATASIAELAHSLGKDVWLWTGFYIDKLSPEQMKALSNVDYVVDGPFIEELADPYSLKFRGSSNQSIMKKMELRLLLRHH